MNAAAAAVQFEVAGRPVSVRPTGSGNVNDTYLAVFRTTFSQERFIIQRINGKVFANPRQIMANLKVVTDHVHRRLEAEADDADRIWQLPRIIPTKTGEDYILDEKGDCWRAISLIASARSYEHIQSLEHAHEAGYVLGQFQRLISDIDPTSLHDTLEGFHVTPRYLVGLDAALATDLGQELVGSTADARHCMRFISARRAWCSVLEEARKRGELLLRPTHGDPKVSNIMIDEDTGKGTSIIDLDTVKPGLIHYDFGDCLRSACNPAGEDEADLEAVYFDTDMCHVIVKGYMRLASEFLSAADRHYLYDSIRVISFELGLRFFADYLAGDVYFKTKHEGHNLLRARVQFKLCESIETREPVIRRILESCD
ncbi:MAG: aminoglycoside phosphotransferase family protein [Lentisphaerae bacterium]|nr:aminoglycoside phosphotransferase family protein [Lentisphaerota bacterium]